MTFNLQSMKRAELQSLSKENGLKANLKTDVLIENLTQHFTKQQKSEKQQQQQITKPVSIVAASARKHKESTRVLPNVRDSEEDASEDEMMLGYTEPIKVVKKVKASTKGKEVAIRHTTPGHRVLTSTSSESSSSMVVKDTSPATKSLIDQLFTTVEHLQRELISTREAHSNLVEIVNSLPTAALSRSPQSSQLSNRDVSLLIDEKLSELRQEWSDTLDSKFSHIHDEIAQLKIIGAASNRDFTANIENLGTRTTKGLEDMQSSISASLESLNSEWTNKFETSTIKKVTLPPNLASPAPKNQSRLSAVYNAINPFISNASPTLSDAPPPVRTLNSFSSPPDSLNDSLSFAERSEVNISPTATGRTSSIFRSPAKILANSNFKLESQVIIHQDSIGRTGAKHSRYSDSNDSAISADSPSIANGNRTDLTMGQGQKKRARMSEISIEEAEEDQIETRFEDEEEEEIEEEEESIEASFISNESSFIANTTVSNKRDTIVSTKSGEELPIAEISTSDPTYFSAPSPHATIKAVAPIAKPSPFKPRKSLPMKALPFPFPDSNPVTTITGAPLGGSSTFNRSSGSKLPPPPTPLSSKTLFGTEIADSRFGDVAETPYAKGASRNSSPAKPKSGNLGRAAWSSFA